MKRIVKISILLALAAMLLAACGKNKENGAGVVYAPGQQLDEGGDGSAAGAGSSYDDGAITVKPSSGGANKGSDSFSSGAFSDDALDEDGSDDEDAEGGSGDVADAGNSKGGFSEGGTEAGGADGADAETAAEGSDVKGSDSKGSGDTGADGGNYGTVTGGPASDTPVSSEGGTEGGAEGGAQGGASAEALDENGTYTTLADVSLYLYTYEKLPMNFITKKQARSLGWSGGGLDKYANGFCIGGDVFGNYEGLLPEKKGRVYHECDIDTLHQKSRGAKRIVYSDDGLIYYTDDHYDSFTLIYEGWASDQTEEEETEEDAKKS